MSLLPLLPSLLADGLAVVGWACIRVCMHTRVCCPRMWL